MRSLRPSKLWQRLALILALNYLSQINGTVERDYFTYDHSSKYIYLSFHIFNVEEIFMMDHKMQIQRIKEKFIKAKEADKTFSVFGADHHKYIINEPVSDSEVLDFEQRYSIQLPECYKAFITQIGDGGTSVAGSCAGPFYGIYPLGKNVNELISEDTEKYIKNSCAIYPRMTDDYWNSLVKNISDDKDISDDEYEKELGKIYAGVLPIGSQGCNVIHGLVLNGEYKGYVVNLELEKSKPHFAFENSFLDWYERWLDEVISGELAKKKTGWFGYSKGGSEEKLLQSFLDSTNLQDKKDCLDGLLNKVNLKNGSLEQIAKLANVKNEFSKELIHLLCKSDYKMAKPFLLELSETDLHAVFQFIFYYAKDKSIEWLRLIEENTHRIDDAETFRYCTYVLKETKTDYSHFIIPFTKHQNEQIRAQAFYALGELKNKSDFIDIFTEGLKDSSNRVIHTTLQALSGVKDVKLLKYYRNLAQRFPIEQDYILVNLNHRLKDYGLTNQSILLEKDYQAKIQKRKWYQIWK